jgi:hypothetical protein
MVSQGGYGASVAAVGVKQIYSALFGVKDNVAVPALAIFPNGAPPNAIPKIDPKNAILKKP